MFRKKPLPHPMIQEDEWPQSRPSVLRRILISIVVILALFLCTGLLYANTAEELSLNQHMHASQSGNLLMSTQAGLYQPAVHLGTEVEARITGMVAKVDYIQSFRNDSTEWKEAVYLFPLSENAAVNEMEMILGDRIIRSEIHEKEEAQRIYTEAKNSGKRAALTEQQRPNMFTQKVANIAPGETIKVRLRFIQRLDFDNGQFGFFLPTTITPRFFPGVSAPHLIPEELDTQGNDQEIRYQQDSFGWSKPTHLVPDAHLISPFMLPQGEALNPIQIKIDLEPGFTVAEITSRNHDIQQQRIGTTHQIELGPVPMDRDFRLEWRPVPTQVPQAAIFRESLAGDDYGLIMLMPPHEAQAKSEPLPREVIFILDTSSSMRGNSIEQAKASLLLALDRLKPTDKFNLIEFNSNFTTLYHAPLYADTGTVFQAQNWVRGLNARGGTNMAPALVNALEMPGDGTGEDYLRQIIFITDGAIGYEEHMFGLIESKLGNARLFTVGIGSAPNSYFMTRAAQFGRGAYEFISRDADVAERMSILFQKLESAVMSGLNVEWQLPGNEQPEQFPARAPDLYYGEPLLLAVKSADLEGQVQISGTLAGQRWARTLEIAPTQKNTESFSGISTVWAKAKVEALMDEKARGRNEQAVRADVLSVALPHKLVTAYSSLVAVEELISRQPEIPLSSDAVPNAVAHGQRLQSQTYPRTSNNMLLSLLTGTLALLIYVLNGWQQRIRLQIRGTRK